MEIQDLFNWGSPRGFRQEADQIWGDIAGIPATGRIDGSSLVLILGFDFSAGDPRALLESTLEQWKSQGSIHDFAWDSMGHTLVLEFLDAQLPGLSTLPLGEKITELGLKRGCHSCGQNKENKFFQLNSHLTSLCAECTAQVKEESQATGKPVSYLLGFLGALAGGIVGSLAWILIGYIGFIASIAGMAIGWAAFYGYQLVKGPASGFRLFSVALSVVFSLGFAEYIGTVLAIAKELEGRGWGFNFYSALALTPEFLSTPGVIQEMLPNLGLGLVFAALGTWGLFKNLASAPAPATLRPLEG